MTGQEKLYGLIVDYVGLGAELAKAVAVKDTGGRKSLPTDVEELFVVLAELVGQTVAPFAGVDRTADAYEQMMGAQERLATIDARADFAERFLRCEALFELLWPDTRLRPIEDDYRWLARIYASVTPTADANALLWHRLGEKTRDLIGSYISDVGIAGAASEAIAIDSDTFEVLRQLELFGPDGFRMGPRPRPWTRYWTPWRRGCDAKSRDPRHTRYGGRSPCAWRNCARLG